MEPQPQTVVPASHAPPDRDELGPSISALTEALAAGGSGGEWVERVRVALSGLAADFRLQARVAQAPDGMHGDVLAAEPRLANAVAVRVREQRELADDIGHLLTYARSPRAVLSVEDVRGRGWALIARLVRHRQGGNDLLHEVDQADIGGES